MSHARSLKLSLAAALTSLVLLVSPVSAQTGTLDTIETETAAAIAVMYATKGVDPAARADLIRLSTEAITIIDSGEVAVCERDFLLATRTFYLLLGRGIELYDIADDAELRDDTIVHDQSVLEANLVTGIALSLLKELPVLEAEACAD